MNAATFDRLPIAPRHLIAIALVVVIGALFAWREFLSGDSGPATVIEAGEANLNVEIGQPAPDFRLLDPDGNEVRLSDFRGQAVVLNFWATWCGPCRAEMPDLQSVHDDHAGTGDLTVLGVNVQESADDALAFQDDLALTFPIVLDSNADLFDAYGLIGLPATFFIDPTGTLQARVIGQLHDDLLTDGLASILPTQTAATR